MTEDFSSYRNQKQTLYDNPKHNRLTINYFSTKYTLYYNIICYICFKFDTMQKLILFSAFLILTAMPFQGISQQDGLILEVSALGEAVIHHTLEPGQTLYGISKTYGVDIHDLMETNPDQNVSELKIGQDIRVPVKKSRLCYQLRQCSSEQTVPVYYIAKKQDNLFRIARIYFDSSVEQLKLLNNISGTSVSEGQVIKIGWLPYSDYLQAYLSPAQLEAISKPAPHDVGIVEEEIAITDTEVDMTEEIKHETTHTDSPVVAELEETPEPELIAMDSADPSSEVMSVLEEIEEEKPVSKSRYFEEEEEERLVFNPDNLELITMGATAYWNKNRSSKKGFYILHKFLPVNTLIEITNPVTRNTVLAKVVGTIPDNIYAPEISMVVTSEVAEALGAIDKKFYTQIKYPDMGL